MAEPLIRVRGLRLALPDLNARPLFGRAPMLEILHGLDLDLPAGSVTGIVGESGSGKSTLGRCLLRLYEPTAGTIEFDGRDITHLDEAAMRPLRREMQMIFQDPMSSLNPRKTVRRLLAEPMALHGMAAGAREVADLLDRVRLPAAFAERYPHQMSGGQRQRIGIARALALRPRFVLADEIVSGLDVSTQAEVLILLEELVRDLGLTMAFISHDLSVVRRLCQHLIVLRAGEIVEAGPVARVFDAPAHPYTAELKAAIPLPDIDEGWLEAAE
jgi:peptide/nickel transport system ATP-binding protein